ncbi:uncharacterized protein [Cherax quadricarinatus]|uniref:uncharacterized protein n=1 Tax=Cherax quadricarinatus TaxID=27406 RepID=UPI002378832E|nr:uncharacterized protein LOC128696888 [Cherax quadricarinatus]
MRRNREDKGGKSEDTEDNIMVTDTDIKAELERLRQGISTIATTCKRMVKMGGKLSCSCETKTCSLDGAKLVCLDEDVRPVPGSCLALNFGIGFEMTFDKVLVNYGCQVIALDPTNANITNSVYDANITDIVKRINTNSNMHTRKFHALNLGIDDKPTTMILNLTMNGDHYISSVATYLTYKAILDTLDNPRVDILKLDIEGIEWRVLNQILNSPDAKQLLQYTHQILLEVHLDFLNHVSDANVIFEGTWITLKTLRLLQNFGFYVAAYDLNETGQKIFAFNDVRIPLYRELTLIKRLP